MRWTTTDPRTAGFADKTGATINFVSAGAYVTLQKVGATATDWAAVDAVITAAPMTSAPIAATDPRTAGRAGQLDEIVLYSTTGAGTYLIKYGSGDTDWVPLPVAYTPTPSGVTPGSYTNTSITVDVYGVVTAASSGAAATSNTPVPPYSTGLDGVLHFDGVATILGLVPAAGVYGPLVRDLFPTHPTIDAGVTVIGAGFGIFATGTATIDGDFQNNGTNGTTGGAAGQGGAGGGRFAAGQNGGIGNSSGGSTTNVPVSLSSNSSAANGGSPVGTAGNVAFRGGGGGGIYSAGASGGTVGVLAASAQGSPTLDNLIDGRSSSNNQFGTGAGGGGADGASPGVRGTGGGGGGGIALTCKTLAGSGTVRAIGGNGGAGGVHGSGGGGGSGGLAVVVYGTKTGTVTTVVTGGTGGAKGTDDGAFLAGAGGAGADGVKVVVNFSGDGT